MSGWLQFSPGTCLSAEGDVQGGDLPAQRDINIDTRTVSGARAAGSSLRKAELRDEDRAAAGLVAGPYLAHAGERDPVDVYAQLPGADEIEQFAKAAEDHVHGRHRAGADPADLKARTSEHGCGQADARSRH